MMTVLCIILGYLLGSILCPGNWQTLLQDRYPPIWFRKSRRNKCRTRSRKESWYFGYRSRCLKSCLSCRSCILGQWTSCNMDKSCLLYWTLLSYLCSFQRWKSRYDHVWILDLYIYFYLSGIQLFLSSIIYVLDHPLFI